MDGWMDGWMDSLLALVVGSFEREAKRRRRRIYPVSLRAEKNSFRILNQTGLTRDCGRQRQETLLLIIYLTLSRY